MDAILSILRKYWGYDDFRGIQREIIESIVAGKDTLGLMPTGGGKSITFQVPALLKDGMCIVVTPLIALMTDQVSSLRRRGIKAAAIHSGMPGEQVRTVLDNCVFDAYKLLYISPERLSSPLFLAKLVRMNVSFVTVDEAHCICQWGYDFRPSYLKIATVRDIKPDCPVLALTATATPEVVKDIQRVLRFPESNVFRMSFFRPNLAYKVRWAEVLTDDLRYVLDNSDGSCIVYVRNRMLCKDICETLLSVGYTATYYHAGLKNMDKVSRQEAWQNDKYRVMVATNAFGMGIDKPDVRLVVHIDIPDSIEEYFQEAGRAGRDGKPSTSVILVDDNKLKFLSRRMAQRFPSLEYVRGVYEKLCCFLCMAIGDGFNVVREVNLERFCMVFHYHPIMLTSALQLLDMAGYIEYRDEEDSKSLLRINATRDGLFRVLDENGKKIFMSLFRHYGGIFVEYVFPDESLVAEETGLDMECIYHKLVELSKYGVIEYIPRKKMPRITFLCRRVDKEDITLPDEVYKKRKEAYEYRLRAMREYCVSTDECRSKMLLSYFGEQKSGDCGVCDVCTETAPLSLSKDEYDRIRLVVVELLEDGPVPAGDLRFGGIQREKLNFVLDCMRANGELIQTEDYKIALGGET